VAYRIEFLPSAYRELARFDKKTQSRIARKIDALAANPRPPGSKKLRDQPSRWRIRVGDYRVIYDIRDEDLLVCVVKLGHRSDVYRGT